jgi:uncharacterized protein YuzE
MAKGGKNLGRWIGKMKNITRKHHPIVKRALLYSPVEEDSNFPIDFVAIKYCKSWKLLVICFTTSNEEPTQIENIAPNILCYKDSEGKFTQILIAKSKSDLGFHIYDTVDVIEDLPPCRPVLKYVPKNDTMYICLTGEETDYDALDQIGFDAIGVIDNSNGKMCGITISGVENLVCREPPESRNKLPSQLFSKGSSTIAKTNQQ